MLEEHADNSEHVGHEPMAVSARAVSIGIAGLFGTVIASLLLVAGLLQLFTGIQGGKATVAGPARAIEGQPGMPALDANQRGTLRQLREREHKLLTEYSWVEPEAGIARIPIQRAMEILSQQPAPMPQAPRDDRDTE